MPLSKKKASKKKASKKKALRGYKSGLVSTSRVEENEVIFSKGRRTIIIKRNRDKFTVTVTRKHDIGNGYTDTRYYDVSLSYSEFSKLIHDKADGLLESDCSYTVDKRTRDVMYKSRKKDLVSEVSFTEGVSTLRIRHNKYFELRMEFARSNPVILLAGEEGIEARTVDLTFKELWFLFYDLIDVRESHNLPTMQEEAMG